MSKAAILQPDLILGGPIVSLTPEILARYQLQGLILDVDETLVPLKEKDVSEELVEWVDRMRQVAALWLVSNNLSENRIGRIAQSIDVPYFVRASKPSRRKLRQAIEAMNLPVSQVAMVGDRLFTDVLAGNRLGMFTILVEPMVDPAQVARSYALRNFEVWFSQALGVSLAAGQQKLTKSDKS
ncbi:MAG: YqeG family HAD IIIA-type phosphatase [Prochloraceae cyanobacterium]